MFSGRDDGINRLSFPRIQYQPAEEKTPSGNLDSLKAAYGYHRSLQEILAGFSWGPKQKTDLAKVLENPPASFDSKDLSNYAQDLILSGALAGLIARIPNREPIQTLGPVPVVWAALVLRSFDSGASFRLSDELAKSRGIDREIVAQAFAAASRTSAKDPDRAMRVIDFMAGQERFLESADVPGLVAKYWKGAPLKQEVLDRYQLRPLRLRDSTAPSGTERKWGARMRMGAADSDVRIYDVYLDSPIAMGLFYMGEPNAILSAHLSDRNGLLISQIQGVRAFRKEANGDEISCNSWGLSKLDWVPLMIEVAAQESSAAGFSSLGIQGAVNNLWVHERWRVGPLAGKPKLPVEIARARYDDNAERLGFSYERSGNWFLDLA